MNIFNLIALEAAFTESWDKMVAIYEASQIFGAFD